MKKTLITIILFLFSSINAFAELQDCSQIKKLSKEYLKCAKDNLKHKSDEAGITSKLKKFKESKSLKEFITKEKK
tara:strand:- start:302 stop:526 length:225 start_codon:yes stop_codon:yes gene_type:complete